MLIHNVIIHFFLRYGTYYKEYKRCDLLDKS